MTMIDERRWHHDPWDDPDITDALVVERPRRQRRPFKWVVWLLCYLATQYRTTACEFAMATRLRRSMTRTGSFRLSVSSISICSLRAGWKNCGEPSGHTVSTWVGLWGTSTALHSPCGHPMPHA